MLTVDDLSRSETKRQETKKEMYKKIYETLSKKIKHASSLHRHDVFVTVPSFVFGYPAFDIQKATEYMRRQFQRGGFDCEAVDTNTLHISWAKKKKSAPASTQETEDPEMFPSFVNLKKIANKYRSQKK